MPGEQDKIKHLLNRASYGYTPAYWNKNLNITTVVQQLFNDSTNYRPIELISTEQEEAWKQQKDKDPGQFKKVVTTIFKDHTKELNIRWMNEMIRSEGVLREKMSVFWHSNLPVRVINPYFNQQYVDVLRKHALGNFGTLLREVSKTPAMLNFLNNQQNKKGHPNENFAREVMELFTLGRGNYTENDIREAARAFTGWGFDLSGNFKFRAQQHDYGQKTILGKTGNFDGDAVLDILLEKKECAYFITKKIYKYFVNEIPDEHLIQSLSAKFYQSNYDIAGLLKEIFTANWFFDEKNIGTKIKSPNDLLVGMFRTIPVQFENDTAYPFLQKMLGQVLLFPPNVAGWPGGRSWIDSSALLTRMRLPQVIYFDKEVNMQPKEEIPEMGNGKMMMAENSFKSMAAKKLGAVPDWSTVMEAVPEPGGLEQALWSKTISKSIVPADLALLKKYTDNSSGENRVKSIMVNLMSLPDYQLC